MRRFALGLSVLVTLLSGCPESHGLTGDAGADTGACGPVPLLICVPSCGVDAGVGPVCTGGGWVCPPGTLDLATCPPGCPGAPPAPGCVCEGTRWSCDLACPPGLEPWNPDAPANACSVEGATCGDGGSACGAGMFCTCAGGRWNCAVAEPDPVCWCGREPRAGDPCAEEGLGCGACCPTPEGPNWPYMVCSGGRWAPGGCPDIVCPPLPCPADTAGAIGAPCVTGQACGDACCDTAIVCEEGRWAPGPVADCAACRSFPCGPGSCRDDQFCRVDCGPADGLEFTCEDAGGCRDCGCVPVPSGGSCEVVDGHPVVRGPLGCG